MSLFCLNFQCKCNFKVRGPLKIYLHAPAFSNLSEYAFYQVNVKRNLNATRVLISVHKIM